MIAPNELWQAYVNKQLKRKRGCRKENLNFAQIQRQKKPCYKYSTNTDSCCFDEIYYLLSIDRIYRSSLSNNKVKWEISIMLVVKYSCSSRTVNNSNAVAVTVVMWSINFEINQWVIVAMRKRNSMSECGQIVIWFTIEPVISHIL